MARKKALAKVGKPAQPAEPASEPAETRAWPVASIVNLENIIIEELNVKRTPEGHAPLTTWL